MEDFKVHIPVFEGPLDLLLSLIEKRKKHISDIPLAQVTDEYIQYIQNSSMVLGDISEFIRIAATLMLIKSRSLLPGLSLTLAEEKGIEELEQKLAKYEKIQKCAAILGEKLETQKLFLRNKKLLSKSMPFPKEGAFTVADLRTRMNTYKIQLESQMQNTFIKKVVHLEEVIQDIMHRVSTSISMKFQEFSGQERMGIIVSFLALLELAKQGKIALSQEMEFADIRIENANIETPRY